MAFTADQELEMVRRWFRGAEDAVRLYQTLAYATQTADDIVDEPLSVAQSAAMMTRLWAALVDLPSNPFWAAHYARLSPLVLAGVYGWEASNEWQRSADETSRAFGYVRREAMEPMITYIAHMIGGPDWAMTVEREVHQFYHVDHGDGETLATWSSEAAPAAVEAAE